MDIFPQLIVNSLISGSIYALASIGLALTYGLLKILNFAHGHILMTGAYMYLLFSVISGYGLIPAALLTLVFSLIFSFLILRIFIMPFISYSADLPLITTLALSTILESLISMFFGVQVRSLSNEVFYSSYEIYGIYITPVQIIIIVSALILLLTMAFVIHCSSFGRKARALSENNLFAESLAINSKSVIYTVFTISTILSVYAGIMIGLETNLQPTMGNTYTIKAFAAMILGGLGNIWGTLLGSLLLGFVENFSIGLDFGSYSIPAGYKDAFAFLIILLMLLFRPKGFFTSASRTS
jgi:branched-chain amino acid transport system permease protein